MMGLQHRDMGQSGSEFTFVHQPKNGVLFVILLLLSTAVAFLMGLHLMDRDVLTAASFILFVTVLLKLYMKIYSESVLILPSLGVQVETRYYLGHGNTHFIDICHIKDITINEAVSMHSILYYLVILLKGQTNKGQEELYPLFLNSWPTLVDLKLVYQATQEKLICSKLQ